MSQRLTDVEARMGSVHQLSAVVAAMRGIAAARSREARRHLDGIRAYAATIGTAISEALALLPPGAEPHRSQDEGTHAVILFCAEQGFVGPFNEHLFDAFAARFGKDTSQVELLIIGDKGVSVAAEKSIHPIWSAPMIAHADQATDLANRIARELFDRLATGRAVEVTLLHAIPGASAEIDIVEHRILPFDYTRFAVSVSGNPPLTTLPPQTLVTRLAEEYIFAELCEAVMLSFAAENEARTRAMMTASANVTDTLDDLTRLSRQLRQEQITTEIVELASGSPRAAR